MHEMEVGIPIVIIGESRDAATGRWRKRKGIRKGRVG